MEKRMKLKVAAGTAALLAVAGGGAAIAATQLSPKQESQTVLNDAAKELGCRRASFPLRSRARSRNASTPRSRPAGSRRARATS